MVRSAWRRLVEAALPWFDRAEEDRRDARTESIRQRSIAARLEAERIRRDYAAAAKRLQR